MPFEAIRNSLDSQTYGPNDRPALFVSDLAYEELRKIPSIEELSRRKGTRGLQSCVDELTWIYHDKNGFDWIYANGEVYTQGRLYFIRLEDGNHHYLGNNFRNALNFFMDYVRTGRHNDALRRAR